jgi:hypothetical protein
MLPAMCQALALDSDELTFTDLSLVVNRWLISTR